MSRPAPILLNDLPEAAAREVLEPLGATPGEARKIWSAALRRHRDLSGVRHVPQVRRAALDAVREACATPRLEIVSRRSDPVDGFTKYLFRLGDGLPVEAVRIPLFETHYVACLSSQVGCALACDFCATGRMGFLRNLRPWEMVEQLQAIRDDSSRPVRGVVFMGMGEPFLNYDAVIAAARILSDPSGPAIAAKAISVSTAGIVPAIRRFTAERHAFRLITSITSAIPGKRGRVMPVERKHPLPDLMDAVREHALQRRTRAMLAYVVIRGFNTGREDAEALRDLVGDTPVKIDLIDVNDATGRYQPPLPAELRSFREHLRALGAPVVRRYSGGKLVEGACGMLAGGG